MDAHIHLTDPEYRDYFQHIINGLRIMNIQVCSVTVDIETTINSISLFDSCSDVVRQFVGIHPQFAGIADVERFKQIFNSNLQSITGVGEIGLDPKYSESNADNMIKQKQVFGSMLELAEKTQKPISVHSRNSLTTILAILPSYNIKKSLLHWFAGNKKELEKVMDMGMYVSYGPVLLYSQDKKELLKKTEKNRLLFETDGPLKYGRCFNNLPALPTSFLVSILDCAAKLLDLAYEEMTEIVHNNATAFLYNH